MMILNLYKFNELRIYLVIIKTNKENKQTIKCRNRFGVNMVGIRGAITVESNEKDAIIAATRELLSEIIKENELSEGEIVAIIFSSTKDLTKAFPAEAARKMGYNETALFCCQELCIEESIERCVRVLIFADGDRLNKKTVKFVYLKGAKALRS